MPESPRAPLPTDRLRSRFHSLGARLFLSLFGLVIAAFALYAWISFRTTSRNIQDSVRSGALNFSEIIKQSTHYGMLLNRKEDVHHIIRTVAETPGVVGVRIYDKEGQIIYSAAEEEIGHQVDLRAEACVICHREGETLHSVPSEDRVRVYRVADGNRVLGLINPIGNAPACSTAACHYHPADQTVLGVLDVKMSLTDSDARLSQLGRLGQTAAVLMALLVGAFSAFFIQRMVRRPVGRLIEGARRIAQGDLNARIEVERGDEIGQLASAFNGMTDELRQARDELTGWSQKLEAKVVEKTDELRTTQRQILQMEKMASLGKLAATVAHELNNPLAGILTYAKLIDRILRDDAAPAEKKEDLRRFLGLIQKESSRSGDIVRNMLLFARRSGAEFAEHSLNGIFERSLMLVKHHLKISEIRLDHQPLAGDDRIVCDAGQLQQALVALFVNAVEAMKPGGTLTIHLEAENDTVRISIGDTGAGIDAEVLPHIFEPFFSTKEDTSGVGLGLAVVYGIVRRHGGDITVDSEVGRGTTFRLVLPRRPDPPPEEESVSSRAAGGGPVKQSRTPLSPTPKSEQT